MPIMIASMCRHQRALLAVLLATLMMVMSPALSANMHDMPTDSPMAHCHGDTSMATADMSAMHDSCPDGEVCQCLTVCQVSATIVAPFHGHALPPARHFGKGPVIAALPGIHHLPLRPPSLTV